MIIMQQQNLPRDQDHNDVADMLIYKLGSSCFAHTISKKPFNCKDDGVEGQQHENGEHHDESNVVIASDEALV